MPLDAPTSYLLNRVVGDQPLGRVIAYHGTRTNALKSILDNGILAHPFRRYHPSRFYQGQRGASVYVTENPDVAREWALSEVDNPSQVTILQVELPADRIVPDEEAPEAERFVGDVPAAWIRAAYPLMPDGSLGPAIRFPSGESPEDPCRRLIPVRHGEAGTAQDSAKLAKGEVDYEHPAQGPDHCSMCDHWLSGACEIVEGAIEPEDWCDRFAPAAKMASDADDDPYPVKLELELTNWDNLRSFVAFLRYVRAAANAGHGFSIEADRQEGAMPEFLKKFGISGEYPKVYVDGDGADHVGRIFLNGKDITKVAQDAMLAMDRAPFKPLPSQRSKVDRGSVRDKTEDGHLHVRTSHISKATVNPYLGEEIPGHEELGLDPAKKYLLLRHPDELKKAAPTFNNLPILADHVPVTSRSHRADLVIGSTGTDATYNHPHLDNSLVFWPQPAIDAIEDEELRELSCAYHYDPDMTPGEYEGQHFDGIMRNIRGNHVALVRDGRAGSDVVVGDSKEGMIMPKFTPAGLVARAALFTYLTPKLAQDSRGKVDLGPVVKHITSKNYDSRRPAIAAAVREQVKGHLAQDADLTDLDNLLDAMKGETESADNMVLDPNAAVPPPKKKMEGEDGEEEDTVAKIKAYLKEEGVDDAIINNLDSFVAEGPPAGGADPNAMDEEETEEEKKARLAGAKDGITPNEQAEPVTKTAMDAAIRKVAKDTEERVLRTQREIREAERFVRPWVGELAMDAAGSAEDVHRAALKMLNVEGYDTMHRDALRPVLVAQPQPGASSPRPARKLAQDAAGEGNTEKSFLERFPSAGQVRFN